MTFKPFCQVCAQRIGVHADAVIDIDRHELLCLDCGRYLPVADPARFKLASSL